jgi:predicted transcriptional regulator
MPNTVTLTLSDDIYARFCIYAETHNRSLANLIETAALRYLQEHEYADEFETAEIDGNHLLQATLQRAWQDAKERQGRWVP